MKPALGDHAVANPPPPRPNEIHFPAQQDEKPF